MEGAFLAGANVRFTRTPEVELVRRRGEDLPDINGRTKVVAPETSSAEVAKPLNLSRWLLQLYSNPSHKIWFVRLSHLCHQL